MRCPETAVTAEGTAHPGTAPTHPRRGARPARPPEVLSTAGHRGVGSVLAGAGEPPARCRQAGRAVLTTG